MRSLCHDVKMKWKAFALQHRTKNKVLVVLILLHEGQALNEWKQNVADHIDLMGMHNHESTEGLGIEATTCAIHMNVQSENQEAFCEEEAAPA